MLLKNDGDLLPLDRDLPQILVGGRAADDVGIQSGGWTITWQGEPGDITEGTSILEAITATVSDQTQVTFDRFGRFDDRDTTQPSACLAVVGEEPYAEGIGDSAELRLPVTDLRLLNRMRDQCDQLAVILISGRPLIVTDEIDEWDAFVAAWLPGTEGQGVADVLFGIEPFSGTLPYTWPSSIEQLPIGRSDQVGEPLFPIGFGLVAH